ncbi:hypothetical protein [Streptosporangium sp. NPDC006930]|uniref:hypothetical protein n=1 Tax=unclassified Streptosporangium TaxID=2632669 RepID=UPI0034264D29
MTPEQDGFSTAETPANEPSRRRVPRSLMLAAATALVVVAGAGVAGATAFSPAPASTPTVTDTATPSAPPEKPAKKGPGMGPKMGFGGHPIHGEFVAPDREGNYVTFAGQYGDVTAVSQGSITVKSADGYTKEYAINSDTRINRGGEGTEALKTGQQVVVMAKVEGETATAVKIHEVPQREGRGRHGHGKKGEGRDKGERQDRDQPSAS